MIVLDASVVANVVGDDGPAGAVARALLRSNSENAAPDLVDVETAAVLRKRWLHGDLNDQRLEQAVNDLFDLPLHRYPARLLLPRMFELRANLTAYEATYVALAEALECPLHTGDTRLSNAPGPRCEVKLVAERLGFAPRPRPPTRRNSLFTFLCHW